MIKIFKNFLYVLIFGLLGKILNSGLSSTNILKMSENKEYEYIEPFIFTITFSEMITVIILTILISIICMIYYEKDFFRIRKISKNILWLEVYFFSFIYGAYQYKLKITPIYLIIYFIYFLSLYIFIYYLKEKKETIYKSDLYKNKERYLPSIDFYLENMKAFSVIGEWGIGKTKLIENFFNGNYKDSNGKLYKNKYEFIYIDVSIYSENEKIIETLQYRIGKLLRKYNFLKLEGRFIKNLFLENETFLKIIYKFLFANISLEENKKELEEKIKEINKTKKVVICFDNLERLNDKNRIMKLFAILDEILPDEIKRIYVYDEEYMIKIFQKGNDNFIEYISKYVFNKIKIEDINIEDVLDGKEKILKEIKKIKENLNDNLNIVNQKINSEFQSYSNKDNKLNNLKERIEKYFEKLSKKLKNPRYLCSLMEYIGNEKENVEYKIEYKLIRDNFPSLTLEDILKENLTIEGILDLFKYKLQHNFLKNDKISLANLEISDKQVEKICQMYIFEVKDEVKELYREQNYITSSTSFNEKGIYFESYYNNIDIDETKTLKELEKYKKEPEKYLFNIIDGIIVSNKEKNVIKELKKYLENKKFKYIIKSENEMTKLFISNYSNKILNLILENIEIYKIGDYKSDVYKICESYQKYHLKKDKKIRNLFFVKFSREKYKEFINLEFSEIENFFKEEFQIKTIKEMGKKLQEELILNKNLILKVEENLYKDIEEAIEVFKKMCVIEIIENEEKEMITKKITKDFIKMGLDLEEEKDRVLLKSRFHFQESIEITKENVNSYLDQLKEIEKELYSEEEKENLILLKIELLKLKNNKI
ncbi:MAG: hypothetical protein MR673_09785 [Fusobacterium perfoetens]|uniref:hypothetical protein n=1 Tax=Fusobacterium perfoetens TaxID=852 RepID=UPI0023F44B2E|nr:hypothetical protein [Fusobacterium perfoetens]MCI6153393.1 hypothetical protein [Fusobacterium perfoetens]MDY3238464.1 hypothetical protein [Fusobacterium perfoetens]